jgi:radical SAM superfamily enzyme YgiQ (UPF0313 family)
LNKSYGKNAKFQIIPVEESKRAIRYWKEKIERDGWEYKPLTVFIGDSDSLIMKTSQLVELLHYLYEQLPDVKRVTMYARAATLYRKTPEELKQIHEAKLDRLHVGLETGNEWLLRHVRKGVTPEEMIIAGQKAIEAGFELSLYVILGLAGKKWTEIHARDTAYVLNEINPHFIRFRTFIPQRFDTKLYWEYRLGELGRSWLKLLSPHETLREAKNLIKELKVNSTLLFDHHSNPDPLVLDTKTFEYKQYKLPEEMEKVLDDIEAGLKIDESKLTNAEDMIDGLL